MLFSANDGQLFKALGIELQLPRQPIERVHGAFDFEAMNTAIDNRDINSSFCVR
jgi:hypothetical protein